ncbi:hypothetical protein O181_019565 [Austropuccinia psidii MF-1]|uniref:Peptidase S8/S53 domain-containing protein n=1 Tax=Austropuccinia psidii MF-1 TaxID=1389203 RepID=A0A9Q3CC22_9BASI|nr:hypothetical protein [Austropuccinia psidii MF-1]
MQAIWFLRAAALSCATGLFPSPAVGRGYVSRPSRYVVEYKPQLANDPTSTDENRQQVIDHLNQHNIPHDDVRPLDSAPDIFSGLSLGVHGKNPIKVLKKVSFIKDVYPVLPVSRPGLVQSTPVANNLVEGAKFDLFEPHVQVAISRLQDQGYKCSGINIAVIDTGCDCSHPALGEGFGKGFKIAKGYDFVGDSYNGTNKPMPDGNPCTTCALHGTHIMGVLAANDNQMGFKGVCPEATMSAYRVFGCREDTNDEVVAAALLRAYKDGAHVFSLSVGAPGGWSGRSLASVVASRIAQKRVVVVSAGNTGQEGMFFATSPSTGSGVLSVGSVQSSSLVSHLFTTSANNKTFHYFATFPLQAGTYPLYPISRRLKAIDDACKELPNSVPNLSGYVVLVRRSQTPNCTFPTQLANLLKKGTETILWVNNNSLPEYVAPDGSSGVSVGVITQTIGEYLRAQYFKASANLTITISTDLTITQVMAPDRGKVSSFSNYGPMFDFTTPTPSVLGVGGNVLSTYPVSAGSFAIASGTSISAPQVAGIAALILNVRGKDVPPSEVYSRIATSGTPVSNFSETKILESVCHQGSGLVNAWCAAFSETLVSPYSIALNDTINFNSTHSISIINKSQAAISYVVEHLPAGTALAFSANKFLPNPWPVPLTPDYASVSFSVKAFTIQPNETVKVEIRFQYPQGLNANELPVYSGFIRLRTSTECESHNLIYYGVAAAMKSRPVLDYGKSYQDNYTLPALDSGVTGLPVPENYVFTLKGHDFPVIEYRLAFGSPLLLFDLVAANTVLPKIPLDSAKNSFRKKHRRALSSSWLDYYLSLPTNLRVVEEEAGSAGTKPKSTSQLSRRNEDEGGLRLLNTTAPVDGFPGRLSDHFLGIQLLGSVRSYGSLKRWNPRHGVSESDAVTFNGSIYDTSHGVHNRTRAIPVPDGKYKILMRGLRVTGDPLVDSDYEAWLSPSFAIKRSVPLNNQNPTKPK